MYQKNIYSSLTSVTLPLHHLCITFLVGRGSKCLLAALLACSLTFIITCTSEPTLCIILTHLVHIARMILFLVNPLSLCATECLVQAILQLCFCPAKYALCDNHYCHPCTECRVSVALKVILVHLSTIRCRRSLWSIFQEKCVSYSPGNTVRNSPFFSCGPTTEHPHVLLNFLCYLASVCGQELK